MVVVSNLVNHLYLQIFNVSKASKHNHMHSVFFFFFGGGGGGGGLLVF